jgi:hypothetical protein
MLFSKKGSFKKFVQNRLRRNGSAPRRQQGRYIAENMACAGCLQVLRQHSQCTCDESQETFVDKKKGAAGKECVGIRGKKSECKTKTCKSCHPGKNRPHNPGCKKQLLQDANIRCVVVKGGASKSLQSSLGGSAATASATRADVSNKVELLSHLSCRVFFSLIHLNVHVLLSRWCVPLSYPFLFSEEDDITPNVRS